MRPGDLDRPWLVAAWPGMGAVALGAATHLQEQLGAESLATIEPGSYFDVSQVPVKDAILQAAQWPQSTVWGWRHPEPQGPDLLLLLGEAQPSTRGFEYCGHVLDEIAGFGVSRVFTFAAMATPSHPRADARVFAVATHHHLLSGLEDAGVEFLGEGEISGLNGVFLAAAAERGLEGICLLGEFPYFASGIANPKASAAVLRVFARLARLELDLSELDRQGAALEEKLALLLERLQQSGQPPVLASPDEEGLGLEDLPADEAPAEKGLPRAARARIEGLFREAAKDRSKALDLKAELDRLGVFRQYEDRFLDLFKRAE